MEGKDSVKSVQERRGLKSVKVVDRGGCYDGKLKKGKRGRRKGWSGVGWRLNEGAE